MACPHSEPVLFAGFGCRRGCSQQTLTALLHQTLAEHDLPLHAVRGIASIQAKADEPGLLALAEALGLPLICFEVSQLARVEHLLSQRSASAFAHTGCWGVAESAALALAEGHSLLPHLRVTRQVLDGATLALACGR